MRTDFEKAVKAAFIKERIGDRIDEIAKVDLHFILPLRVFKRYETLIEKITDGDFNVAAGYNLVLLYTDAQNSQLAGTVMFGREIEGLIAAWSNVLDDIAMEADKSLQIQKFKQAHAHFRSALWTRSNPSDPCASANYLPKRSSPPRKPLWKRFLN